MGVERCPVLEGDARVRVILAILATYDYTLTTLSGPHLGGHSHQTFHDLFQPCLASEKTSHTGEFRQSTVFQISAMPFSDGSPEQGEGLGLAARLSSESLHPPWYTGCPELGLFFCMYLPLKWRVGSEVLPQGPRTCLGPRWGKSWGKSSPHRHLRDTLTDTPPITSQQYHRALVLQSCPVGALHGGLVVGLDAPASG